MIAPKYSYQFKNVSNMICVSVINYFYPFSQLNAPTFLQK